MLGKFATLQAAHVLSVHVHACVYAAMATKPAKVWHYVFNVDHHLFFQGVFDPPTVCGAEAYAILESRGRERDPSRGHKYCVVGRFLVVTMHGEPHICSMIVRSTTYAPTLVEPKKRRRTTLTPSEEAAENEVFLAFDEAVRDARTWLRLAWIPEGDANPVETWEDDMGSDDDYDGPCPCVGYSWIAVKSIV